MNILGIEIRRKPAKMAEIEIDYLPLVVGEGGLAYRITPKPGHRLYRVRKNGMAIQAEDVTISVEKID